MAGPAAKLKRRSWVVVGGATAVAEDEHLMEMGLAVARGIGKVGMMEVEVVLKRLGFLRRRVLGVVLAEVAMAGFEMRWLDAHFEGVYVCVYIDLMTRNVTKYQI